MVRSSGAVGRQHFLFRNRLGKWIRSRTSSGQWRDSSAPARSRAVVDHTGRTGEDKVTHLVNPTTLQQRARADHVRLEEILVCAPNADFCSDVKNRIHSARYRSSRTAETLSSAVVTKVTPRAARSGAECLASTTTSRSSASKRSTSLRPRKPVPPVTKVFMVEPLMPRTRCTSPLSGRRKPRRSSLESDRGSLRVSWL